MAPVLTPLPDPTPNPAQVPASIPSSVPAASTITQVEQDVAKLALESILKRVKDEGCPLLHEDTLFCKSILNELAVKVHPAKPAYNTIQSPGLLPVFMSTLVFNGSKRKLYAALDRVKDPSHSQPNIVHGGVKFGCFETTISQKQEVRAAIVRDVVPESAISPAASGMRPPHHEFNRSRPDPAPEPAPFQLHPHNLFTTGLLMLVLV
ncbi:hypothetical protein Peur_015985 [Populus x canadensis]